MNKILAVDIGTEFGSPFGQTKSVGDLVSLLLTGSITIASIIVMFLLVGGAVTMIMSAGNGDAKGAAQGKQAITWAIVGFVVVLMAFLIVKLVEQITGGSFITNPFDSTPCNPTPGSPC